MHGKSDGPSPSESLPALYMLNYSLQAWDFSQGHCLFDGEDPCVPRYSTRAHLAGIIGLLGPPPEDLLRRGRRSLEFFE